MRVISTREAPSTRHQSGSATTARPKASIAATDGDEGDEDEDEDDEDDEDDEGNWVDVKVSSTRASKATQSQPSRPRPRPRIQPVAQAWHPSRSSSSSLNTHHHKSHKPPRTAAVTDDDVVLLENPPHTTYRKATEPARHPLPDILSQDEDEGAALIPQRKVDRRASAYHASQGRVARRGRDDAESDGPDIVEVERYEPPQPSVDESRTNRKAKGKAQRDIGVGRPPMTEVGVASANTRLYSGDHRPRAASPKRAARGSGTAESYGQNRLPRMRSRSRSDSRSPPPRRVGGGAAKARGYSDKPARSHSRSRSRSQSPRHTGGGAAGTARRYNPPHRSPSRSQSPVRATDTTAHGKRGRPRPPSPRREITVTSGARSKPRPQSPARPGKPSKTNVAAEPRDEGEGEGEWVYDEGEESGTGKERKTPRPRLQRQTMVHRRSLVGLFRALSIADRCC
ncbi:hypothetical protein BOTBODRAFT_298668 [Botryobasidium botryosum FD-172 SS1]|uniref:Uncharacterized protein n=1 Tax=Botryobasidium botryosum (strain FD-172 SS1) TaxID=930990 RepID=A0A067M2E0_BOTB1|nr:hypothetical protein BOTBODRAFT_298668 [Botryobasidium botryosum FD-172 SS1]